MFRRKPKPKLEPTWLIVGLGNPGPEYEGTRHNLGFAVIDRLAHRHKIKLGESRHRARYGIGLIGGEPVVLAKPLTYMNLSGQSVAPLLRAFGLPVDRLLVIADETDLPLGRLRLRAQGSAGGHNGHKSLIASLGTNVYARLRLGIGRVDKEETIDHVLSKFTGIERQVADEMIDQAADAVERVLEAGVERTMPFVNGPGDATA